MKDISLCIDELKWTLGTEFTHKGEPYLVIASIWDGHGHRRYCALPFGVVAGEEFLNFGRHETLGQEMVETELTVYAPQTP